MSNLIFAIVVNGIVILGWLYLLSKDKQKGLKAVKIGLQTIFSMLPMIIGILSILGVLSSFVSPDQISKTLGDQAGLGGFFFISIVSSFMQIPGIIAFPIAASLKESGAAIATVAVFACASTMSSVITFPIEIKYLGKKLPIIRITLTYIICVIVGLLTGFIFKLFS
jgi:uncharacterized membrane protein YraQ (UPF0718 family)